MPYKITHIKDENYLQVNYTGTDSLALRMRMKDDIERICTKTNVAHVLIDMRNSERKLEQDDFSNFSKSFEASDFYAAVTLAVLVSKIDVLNKGLEAAMGLMGVNKKIFKDEIEAIAWLLPEMVAGEVA